MFEKGRIVISAAGRDKGALLAVIGSERGRVLVSDGKERKLESPKAKNPKHLKSTPFIIENGSMATNLRLRRTLRQFKNQERRESYVKAGYDRN